LSLLRTLTGRVDDEAAALAGNRLRHHERRPDDVDVLALAVAAEPGFQHHHDLVQRPGGIKLRVLFRALCHLVPLTGVSSDTAARSAPRTASVSDLTAAGYVLRERIET
jgi:hypothetical protein